MIDEPDAPEPLELEALSKLEGFEAPAEAIRWALADRGVISMLAAVDMAEFQLALLNLRDKGAKAVEIERLEKAVTERRREQRRDERAQAALEDETEELDPLEQAAASIGEADRRIDDLDATLRAAVAFLSRFVWFPHHLQAHALALWVMHTYCMDAAETTPRVSVRAPTKACGKSRLLEVLNMLVLSPEYQIVPTAAVAFRLLGSGNPVTLLIDEIDTVYGPKANGNEDLRGVIDAGQRRGGMVARCQGDEHKIVRFPVFGPMAMGGIGRLPGTVEDRCIIIHLAKKSRDVEVERFRPRKKDLRAEAEELRGLMAAWAKRHADSLTEAEPQLPDALSDRQQDGWEPLLAIADAAGGEWPRLARAAAITLSGSSEEIADDSDAVKLLSALKQVFRDAGFPDWLASSDAVDRLNRMEDEPWGDWRRGTGLRARDLAQTLLDFGVKPWQHKADGKNRRGYRLGDLQPVWQAYLSDTVDVTDSEDETYTPEKSRHFDEFHPLPATPQVNRHFWSDSEGGGSGSDFEKSASDQGGSTVADENPEIAATEPGCVSDDDGEWWK